MINPCVLIPIYNHGATIADVLAQIAPLGLPCIIVNDGSDDHTRQVLADVAARDGWIHLIHHPVNTGKGSALRTGLHYAAASGYSHVVQIDADGQHYAPDIERFLAVASTHPSALILGKPIFGPDVPRSRYVGRKLSQWCVRAETLSGAIADPLCGFRVYPVATTVALLQRRPLGCRMDFDPEIAVRLYWDGVAVHNVDTVVMYPETGLSHFRLFEDNVRISWMHTRLLIGMVGRAASLLRRRLVA